MRRLPTALAAIVLIVSMPHARAQTAGMTGFQALIKDSDGDLVDGPVDLEFRIFDAKAGGNLVDMDGDGDVDLFDFLILQFEFTGVGNGP